MLALATSLIGRVVSVGVADSLGLSTRSGGSRGRGGSGAAGVGEVVDRISGSPFRWSAFSFASAGEGLLLRHDRLGLRSVRWVVGAVGGEEPLEFGGDAERVAGVVRGGVPCFG
jgi:hypothetical protein